MYNLKRSKAAKIISFFLAVFFIFSATFSLFFAVFAFSRGVSVLSDDIFNSVYEELSHLEARILVSNGVMRAYIDGNIEEFLKNHPQFTKERTNFSFSIKDETGKVLFSNFEPSSTLSGYSWESYYYVYSDGLTELSHEDLYHIYGDIPNYYHVSSGADLSEPSQSESKEALDNMTDLPSSETITTEETESEEPGSNNEETEASVSEPTNANEITENTTSDKDETTSPEDTNESKNPLIGENEQVYIVDDRDEGFDSIFMFIYPDGAFRNEIYNYCYKLYRNEYEPLEASYYRNGMYEVYHQDDFAVSENGYVYFIGDEREKPTSTQNRELTEEKIFYLVVSPDAELSVKDIVYYASLVKKVLNIYFSHFSAFTVLFIIAAIFFTVLSLTLAGYVKGKEEPVSRGLHKMPMDLLFIIFVVTVIAFVVSSIDYLIYSGYYGNYYYVGEALFLTALPIIIFICLYIFAVKLKTHTCVSSILCVNVFRWFKSLIKNASNALNVLWKLGIVYVLSGIVSIFTIIATNYEGEAELIIYIVFKVLEIIPLLLIAANLHTLQTGARDISEGKLKYVANRFLFGEFRKNAEYLNNMSNSVNIAVEERLKSESTKTELITNVSHDLKTPLTSIVNYIDLLKKEELNNTRAAEYVEVIDRQSQRLKKLTTDIVDASKAAAGNLEINMEKTDLNVLLGQVNGEYSEKLVEKHLSLVNSIPEESIYINADGRLLWRVFDNLMNNICKYSMQHTRVYLSLKQNNNKANIVFRNISAEELPADALSLTERFVRGDASRGTEGSGLGLYIAKSLTENMGGSFSVSTDGDLFK
ncbi:MAG: HAMP domain-containing histidine kinase, partial [Oscillospiraceae bacterium]|nr:HAMP domain-containing histidine kinase [Oscillospiraceae bacterium]